MPSFPRRGLIAIAATTLGLALVLSFKTPDATPVIQPNGTTTGTQLSDPGSTATPGSTAAPGSTATTGSTAAPGASAAPGSSVVTVPAGTLKDGTVTGQLEQMRFGPVQVQVTISGGRITDVTAVALPTDGRSGRISSYAEPVLRTEALAAQSATIDVVSGATYTSQAYAASLQSALDQARG